MKTIKTDLEKAGWIVELKSVQQYPILLIPFTYFNGKLLPPSIRIIKRIVAGRAGVTTVHCGTFHAIIISK